MRDHHAPLNPSAREVFAPIKAQKLFHAFFFYLLYNLILFFFFPICLLSSIIIIRAIWKFRITFTKSIVNSCRKKPSSVSPQNLFTSKEENTHLPKNKFASIFLLEKNMHFKIRYQQKAHALSSKHLFLHLPHRTKYSLILCSTTICCQFLSAAKLGLDFKGSMQIPAANGTCFYFQKEFTALCGCLISTCSYLSYIQTSEGTCLNLIWYIHPVHLWKVLQKNKVEADYSREILVHVNQHIMKTCHCLHPELPHI